MDILVTGATGFIGSRLCKDLSNQHRIFALSRRRKANIPGITWLLGDLSRDAFVYSLPEKVDVVVHLAQSRSYRMFPDQAQDIFNVNVSSTLTLLEYARKVNVSLFIFASTANVYKQSNQPINEDSLIAPASFYARSKRMAEMLIESYSEYFNCTILRFFTVYGPGQKNMLIPSLIDRIRDNKPIQVQGVYGFKTSPIFVSDISKIVRTLIMRKPILPGINIFNVGGDEVLGIFEMGQIIGDTINCPLHIDYLPGDEPLGWIADNSKLKNFLKLEKFFSFRDGIKTIFSEVEENSI